MGDRRLRNLFVAWAIVSVVGVLLVIFLLGPHLPPGSESRTANDQREANLVIAALMTPITLALLLYFGYALRTFRQRGAEIEDGPPLRGNARLQGTWIISTLAVVLALAVYGGWALFVTESGAAGAGGGQGPTLISAAPKGSLQVQVIAQQWVFTYRFPQYGGVETTSLELPVNRTVVFHVTSLDAVHSFWAYQLGVKADAVPGADNVVDVTPDHTQTFDIRCAELCGLWHGAMSQKGQVVGQSAFASWIAKEQTYGAAATAELPPYNHVYYPDPHGRAG
jgi:cytochrome c oxidase subunit II